MSASLRRTTEINQPDLESAGDDYAERFRGRGGRWLLSVQDRLLRKFTAAQSGLKVLDVGGGHGQIVAVLAKRKLQVTILASSIPALGQAWPYIESGLAQYRIGELTSLPVPKAAYDIVTCFRILPHSESWQTLVAELCRVSKEIVIVDYPTRQSLNAISSSLFFLKKRIEGNTRHYALFTHNEIEAEFQKHGFKLEQRINQFFFPMVIHRVLGVVVISAAIELLANLFGLTFFYGSPTVAKFRRR